MTLVMVGRSKTVAVKYSCQGNTQAIVSSQFSHFPVLLVVHVAAWHRSCTLGLRQLIPIACARDMDSVLLFTFCHVMTCYCEGPWYQINPHACLLFTVMLAPWNNLPTGGRPHLIAALVSVAIVLLIVFLMFRLHKEPYSMQTVIKACKDILQLCIYYIHPKSVKNVGTAAFMTIIQNLGKIQLKFIFYQSTCDKFKNENLFAQRFV